MNVRFAEPCRDKPLELEKTENEIRVESVNDGRKPQQLAVRCEQDIYLGFFFDGTNNNKYRDTAGFGHSNVARLYEVYPGSPARQTEPSFLPRVNADGSTSARGVFPDQAFTPATVPAGEIRYYRKVYIPGVGTPMPDVGDTGTGLHKTLGLAMAGLAQIRLDWACLQLVNQVHAAVFGAPLHDTVMLQKILSKRRSDDLRGQDALPDDPVARAIALSGPAPLMKMGLDTAGQAAEELLQEKLGRYDAPMFKRILDGYKAQLADMLKKRGTNKPTLRKIRLSVFGFSRGAAEARSWANLVIELFGTSLCGIPLQFDFLGLFDTVASVGVPHSAPYANGHFAWAGPGRLVVSQDVKRCAHLVSAHEVRGSFPLDSVCHGEVLPPNCKEIVYPGMHSDVGGGYPPGDQGRARGAGAAGDCRKLSQLTLAQMYREARMAGVPLAPESAMIGDKAQNFAIHPDLRRDFNAYVEATRMDRIPPTEGKGDLAFGRMFPTESQPREKLSHVMSRHAAYLLMWRKHMMSQPGGLAGLAGLQQSTDDAKHQDIEDFRGAEAELKKEIAFLQDTDPGKVKKIDDPWLKHLPDNDPVAAILSALRRPSTTKIAFKAAAYALIWFIRDSVETVMAAKQSQWDAYFHAVWHGQGTLSPENKQRVAVLFEHYVHDSRAWFKPMIADDGSKTPDDEDWFVLGGREAKRKERIQELEARLAQQKKSRDLSAYKTEEELKRMREQGPLVMGGREPYQMWGYVRHRMLYQSGSLAAITPQSLQIDAEEAQRRRERMKEEARKAHEAEIKRIKETGARIQGRQDLDAVAKADARQTTQYKLERENKRFKEEIDGIDKGQRG